MPGEISEATTPWEDHKETIRVLYLEQNKTQEEVREIFSKEPYNLPSS
jgi:hypothetical protein